MLQHVCICWLMHGLDGADPAWGGLSDLLRALPALFFHDCVTRRDKSFPATVATAEQPACSRIGARQLPSCWLTSERRHLGSLLEITEVPKKNKHVPRDLPRSLELVLQGRTLF